MFGSFEDLENSKAFWVFFIFAFPIAFGAIWTGVLWITSHLSGWRQLARRYSLKDEVITTWMQRGGGGVYRARFPFIGMRGRLAVGANAKGIAIKPPIIMRPYHPMLFLPFADIASEEDFTLLTLDFVTLTMTSAPEMRIGILKTARQMAEDGRTGLEG